MACTGLVSSSGNSTVIDQQMKDAKAAEDAKAKKKQRIILGVTIPLALLLAAALGGLGFLLYRRRQKMKQEEVAEIFVDNVETDGPITPVSYYSHSAPPIPSKKRSEINQHPTSFISSPGGTSAEPGSPERLSHSGVVPADGVPAGGSNGEELVIQHTDASEVKELPPPYKDNRADGPSAV